MSQLSQFACSPVGDDEPALTPEELENLLPLVPSWALVIEKGVRKLRATSASAMRSKPSASSNDATSSGRGASPSAD
jgi:hypothetical protein